jgi:hypothetical protein
MVSLMSQGPAQDGSDAPGPAPLTHAEIEFLDRYSGTTPDPAALKRARSWTKHALASTRIPDVPHVDEIRRALPPSSDGYEAIVVTAFVDNGTIDDPESDESMSVRAWLTSGRDPSPVLALAESLNWSI